MYSPYLMIGYAVAVVLMLAGCRISARGVPGLAGLRLLSWAFGLALAGTVLLALRPITPAWSSIVVGNEAIFGFSVLYLTALAQCLHERPRWLLPLNLGLLAAGLIGQSYFTYLAPSLIARIFVCTLIPAACAAAGAHLLFRSRTATVNAGARASAYRPITRALAWLLVLIVVQNLARCVLTVLYPPSQVLQLDAIQAAWSYLNLILHMGAGGGLIWIALWIHREDLHTRADTDGLTGLLNRRAFEEILARELRQARLDGRSVSVMLSDIDHFKQVNDVWGHQAGDEVIRQVSGALRKALRPSDTLARFGGEEFAVLVCETSLAQALEIAERLRTEVAALARPPDAARITISIGLAESDATEQPGELLRRCDLALYQSKRDGRNRTSVASKWPDQHGSVLPNDIDSQFRAAQNRWGPIDDERSA